MMNINWKATEERAKNMTKNQLAFAIGDCLASAQAMGTVEMFGKDASYYMDELSVYNTELQRRTS